jgi:hypothetical protein
VARGARAGTAVAVGRRVSRRRSFRGGALICVEIEIAKWLD